MSEFQKNLFQNRLRQAERKFGFNFDESLEGEGEEEEEEEEEEEDADDGNSKIKDDEQLELGLDDKKDSSNGSIDGNCNDPDEDTKFSNSLPKASDFFEVNDIYCEPSTGYCFQTYYTKPMDIENDASDENRIIFIAHHGAGSSGLTFAQLSKSIKAKSLEMNFDSQPGLFTFDMRGHGKTNLINCTNKSLDNLNYSLSIEQFLLDFKFILTNFIEKNFLNYNIDISKISIFLIGHSLGGSVLTKFVFHDLENGAESNAIFKKSVKGLIMIDIVEDTAIKALDLMPNYLSSMPKTFSSLKNAINWHLNSNLLNNYKSAVISVPPLFSQKTDKKYHWIIDLKLSERYWNNWFINLSENFIKISNKVSKMLILANNDYLDKNLIIGQMQGKYQLVVFHNNQLNLKNTLTTATKTINSNDSNKLGHFIHEDIPDKLAVTVLEFVERNDGNVFIRSDNSNVTNQLDLLNKLNAKWGVKR